MTTIKTVVIVIYEIVKHIFTYFKDKKIAFILEIEKLAKNAVILAEHLKGEEALKEALNYIRKYIPEKYKTYLAKHEDIAKLIIEKLIELSKKVN